MSLEVLKGRVVDRMGPLPQSGQGGQELVGRGICFDMPVFDVSAIPVLGKSGVGTAVELFSDGSAVVYAGGSEMGQGVSTVLAQIAAEELGIDINDVIVEMTDSATSPPAGRSSASRLTYVLGNSLLIATANIKNTLLDRAALMLEANREDLELDAGEIRVKGTLASVALKDVAYVCASEGIILREQGWYKYPEARLMYGHTFMVSAVDVSVDKTTGEVRILKLLNVHDTGKVINPVLARGQQYGGSLQALGYALMENFIVEKGRVMTPSLVEYMIPTSLDIPEEFLFGIHRSSISNRPLRGQRDGGALT